MLRARQGGRGQPSHGRTKAEEAVVDGLEAHLGANVADLDARQRRVVHEAADLDKERVRAEVLAVQEQTRHQNHKVGGLAQATADIRRGHTPALAADARGTGSRASRATDPGHHLSDVTVGLWMMNSCDALS